MSDHGKSTDIHGQLQALGAAAYSPHQFDFSLDMNPLIAKLSPLAHLTFRFLSEELADDGQLTMEQLYARSWREDPTILSKVLALYMDEQVELLTLYTFPLHEARHHADFLTTPFGARFYTLLAQEYLAFQDCSPLLLQNQEFVSGGPVVGLAERLARVDVTVPAEWSASWAHFRMTTENLLATVDTRGLETDRSRAQDRNEEAWFVANTTFRPVLVYGRALSFRLDRRPGWYMRASTLLEGRAVVESLLWIIDAVGLDTPELPDLLRAYMKTNYGPNTGYDYRFLTELAAWWVGDADFDSLLRRPMRKVQILLHMVDNAAWFALNAGYHISDSGAMHPENIFRRFLFGVATLWSASTASTQCAATPYDILQGAESQEEARAAYIISTPLALDSALRILDGLRAQLPRMWQPDMPEHFDAIFRVLSTAIARRSDQGLAFPAGAPANGNVLWSLDEDTYADLFRPYAPAQWVKQWFEFRNKSMFTITTKQTSLTYLRAQFGLAEVAIRCECGALVSQVVPKWRPDTMIRCPSCGRSRHLTAADLTFIRVPEDVEQELASLLQKPGEHKVGGGDCQVT
jgi:hypothetical protein